MTTPTATQTRIYNRALALLGSVNRSVNADDGKPWTDALNELWPAAVGDLLAEHPWNCAIGRKVLNRGAAPEWGCGHTYALPPDCLRWLPPMPDSEEYFAGVQEGNAILADAGETIKIRYIRLVDDVSIWPPHLVTAMSYRLAMDAAEALTQSSGIVQDMLIKYCGTDGEGGALAAAKRADGLATGDRERGNVSVRSRALSAAATGSGHYVPGIGWR